MTLCPSAWRASRLYLLCKNSLICYQNAFQKCVVSIKSNIFWATCFLKQHPIWIVEQLPFLFVWTREIWEREIIIRKITDKIQLWPTFMCRHNVIKSIFSVGNGFHWVKMFIHGFCIFFRNVKFLENVFNIFFFNILCFSLFFFSFFFLGLSPFDFLNFFIFPNSLNLKIFEMKFTFVKKKEIF